MEAMMGYGGWGFGLAFLNFLGLLLFFIFLFWAFHFFVWGRPSWRGDWRHMRGPLAGDEALKAARERFAKGEISREEYERIKAGLEQEQAPDDWKTFWHRDSALEVARLRFARGEITLEEFEVIKKGLQN
ncbi:SHOCT domain-containing protein [Calidithermus roseus]|uniref:SHOCT domain-containing protein n=1 Tax=Calidithermus roseus TaxID=1644118 RepID=A0A399EWT9_9DEIN|nr:SHOCT domain-containing protein [Calidithermus roseus]RIH88105.1 hypothetical protein Mrose_01009 [Calidithermus roseus]